MKYLLRVILFLFCTSSFAASNSNPGLYYGQIPTPAQWNSYFSTKLDYNAGSANTLPYWDGAGNLLNSAISGDCTAVANVFTCPLTSSATTLFAIPPPLGSTTPNTGAFTTLSAGVTTLMSPVRSSGVSSYFTINIPADTGQTASTESIGLQSVTATRTWATTGTVALQRENFLAGPTYASASASQTFTDPFTLYLTAPIAGTNAIFTRKHTLGVVDATSASSSITGGLVISAVIGTQATSCGIGGGNVSCGGTSTFSGYQFTNLLTSSTAPTIASGFGTSPSVVSSNGTATFKINVGTGGTATGGVVTMPAATTGYNCIVTPAAAPQAAATMYSVATSTTSITITNYTATTGVALAWTSSTIIAVSCVGF